LCTYLTNGSIINQAKREEGGNPKGMGLSERETITNDENMYNKLNEHVSPQSACDQKRTINGINVGMARENTIITIIYYFN